MAIVSVTEAGLVGKSRKTLQRAIKAGKLSKSLNDAGQEGVEIVRI